MPHPKTREGRARNAANQRAWYARNKAKAKAKIRKVTTEKIARSRQKILEYLLCHPCVDCGNADPEVLEFDHVRGRKDRAVSRMVAVGCGWARIEKEIQKCEIRCANCHRKATRRREREKTGRWRNW